MIALATTTLENEMDLTLAYKKSIQVGSMLGLTIATQTAFATAVSEVSREVMDKAADGEATIGVRAENERFVIYARITYTSTEKLSSNNTGFEYARRLVPFFEVDNTAEQSLVMLKMTLPLSLSIDMRKVRRVAQAIDVAGPINSYEEIKIRNSQLQLVNLQTEIELDNVRFLDKQKNEFLSIASHELNSPLTVAHALAQLSIEADDGHNEQLTQYLQKLEFQTSKLVALTKQLFDISRMETGHFIYQKEKVPADDFLKNFSDNAALLAPRHQLNSHIETGCIISVDKLKMEQVLNNIVNNAAKYSDPNTTITISAELVNEQLKISVADEGMGMTAETLNRVFEKFYRGSHAASHRAGLGMGLYVAHKIVEDHQGQMQVESESGKGSVLSVFLPVCI